MTLPPDFWPIAKHVCTAKELEALRLRAGGQGPRRIARALGISHQAVTDRLTRARTKIEAEREKRAEAV